MARSFTPAPASRRVRGIVGTASVALAALLSVSALAQGGPPPGGGPGGFGGEGPGKMGPPRRPPEIKPLKREDFDKAVTAMFRKADVDGDGVLTLAELRTEIEARRASVIAERFRRLDTNGNGSIDLAEFTTWQQQMGSLVLSDDRAPHIDPALVPATIGPDLGRKDDDLMLRDLIEPLNATLLAKANTDYDKGTTLAELLAYEGARFQAADADRDGRITADEMRSPGRERGPRRDGVPDGFQGRPPR
jgi:hypothetical protein